MNLITLNLAYFRRNALGALLNLLLLALGIATLTVLLLFSHQLEQRMSRDAQGIDLVVGAKGSPMQLILSSIFHMDTPTGNIPLADARWLDSHPLVSRTIPLALGDSYRGHRIVGSNHAYVRHYGATAVQGRLWTGAQEATLGADVALSTGLSPGDVFAGVHGIIDGGHDSQAGSDQAHDDYPYRVVGILGRTGTVLDRLILVSVGSVWAVHALDAEHHDADHGHAHDAAHETDHGHGKDAHTAASDHVKDMHGHGPEHGHAHEAHYDDAQWLSNAEEDHERQLTALLVQYRSPLAAVLLPRVVNARNALQAASPAIETARLMRIMGVGMDALRAFGWMLVLAAGLGVFIALYNAMQDRRYDLALMRALGASPITLVGHVLLEAFLLTALGAALGLLLGHVAAELLGQAFRQTRQLDITGFVFIAEEIQLFLLATAVGLLAALIPAVQAYRTDIAPSLARG